MIGNITRPDSTQPSSKPSEYLNSNIYIMDIRNYTWLSSFESTNVTTETEPEQPSSAADNSSKLVTTKIVVGVISAIVGTVVIIITGIFVYQCYRSRQNQRRNEIVRISGSYRESII